MRQVEGRERVGGSDNICVAKSLLLISEELKEFEDIGHVLVRHSEIQSIKQRVVAKWAAVIVWAQEGRHRRC